MPSLRVLVALAVLTAPACIEMEQTVTIAADGSGRQAVVLELGEATLAELAKTSQAAALGAAPNATALFDRALVTAELAAAGLELVQHETKTTAGRRRVALEASFADFAALQRSPLCGTAAQWVLAAGPRPGTAKLTLYPQGEAAWTEARAKAQELAASNDPVAAEFFRKRRQQLADIDVVVRLRVPGDVLVWTRNLEKTGEREVTARITAERLQTPEDLVRWLAPRFEIVFDATTAALPL